MIKFSYNAFAGADTTVISSVTAVSVTTSSTQLPAAMATIVANEISTTLTSSTTQYPLSSQTTVRTEAHLERPSESLTSRDRPLRRRRLSCRPGDARKDLWLRRRQSLLRLLQKPSCRPRRPHRPVSRTRRCFRPGQCLSQWRNAPVDKKGNCRCCPAMWRSLTPIATATQQRRDKRVVEFFEKRNDDAAPTLVTTGVGQPASVVVSTISVRFAQ